MGYPYPWHYIIRWPIYFNWPSMKNRTNIQPVPDQHEFQPPQDNEIKLLFCGDIMVQNKDRIPTLDPKLCALIRSADLFIGNCEGPIGNHAQNPDIKYGFRFHFPRNYITNIIEQTGLPPERWLLSTANNHTGDKGYEAALDSLEIMKEIGIKQLGRYTENVPPFHIEEIQGKRFGFAAWTRWMNCEVFPSNDPCAFRTKHIMQYDWAALKKEHNLDYLFGIPHWEYEFQHFPHQETRTQAKTLVDKMGIDFIVGIHTHTLQPMEWFENGFCVYNLGNFCGLGHAWSIKLITLLELTMSSDPNTKNPLLRYKLHYFFQHHDENNHVTIRPLEDAPAMARDKITDRIHKLYKTKYGLA